MQAIFSNMLGCDGEFIAQVVVKKQGLAAEHLRWRGQGPGSQARAGVGVDGVG
jgi:hypothetical protein